MLHNDILKTEDLRVFQRQLTPDTPDAVRAMMEDTAHNSGGFLVNRPFAFYLFGGAVATADTIRTAQALFRSGLKNSFDFAAGVGNVPLLYHVAQSRWRC